MSNFVPRLLRWARGCALLLAGGSVLGLCFVPMVSAEERGELCAECHEPEQIASFNTSFHAKIWQGDNECQSCHGDIEKHLDGQSKDTVISFSKDGGRIAEELSRQCLGCHVKSAKLSMWDMGAHKKNDVACTACHGIHQPRAIINEPEVCFGCHREVRADVHKISHHPIVEGKVTCSDCHNPHGTLAPHMITAENTNQLCCQCHADKRGPFVWQHPPVEEDCLICHTPHGSRHETLLVEKVVTLCQNCHDDALFHDSLAFTADNGFAGTQPASNKGRFVGRACLECHHAIHGSANFRKTPLSR